MVRDFFYIIAKCISSLNDSALLSTVFLALMLGALCWVACSYYTRLWNKRFRVKFPHHLLCAMAAVLTVIFTVQYRAVGNLENIVDDIIGKWSKHLLDDSDFKNKTYETAFYALKVLYSNEFKDVPAPDAKGTYIPVNNNDMKQICVEIYVKEACADFSTQRPFLDKMLRARPGISEEKILDDINDFFRNNPGTMYPLERAVKIAAKHIRENLLEQSPKTVWKTRLILIFLFLAAQMIPFGTIGYFAYKDLNIKQFNHYYQ